MDIQGALLEVVGRRTVPQVFVKGKHIGGSDGKHLTFCDMSVVSANLSIPYNLLKILIRVHLCIDRRYCGST